MKNLTRKLIPVSAALATIVSLGVAFPAHAEGGGALIGSITLVAIMFPIATVAYVIGFIASWFVALGGTLTNWALDLNSQLLYSISIKTGWVLARDLANLGFVLVIIFVAFTTILRIESYQTKKILVRLITSALLINFSLVIAGVFIDFSGLLTNFFLSEATGGPNNISLVGPKLAGAFQAQTLLQQKSDQKTIQDNITNVSGNFNKFTVFMASISFVGIFTTITAISLLSLAAMLFVRYIALTILLILMPIAWLFYIWPEVEKYWKRWWDEFLHWVFFAPAVSFFIYLALQIVLTFQKNPGTGTALPVDGADSMALLIQNFGSIVGQMLSVLGILYGGMYTAQKMGIAGADVGFSVAGRVKGMLTGAAGYAAGRAGIGGYVNRKSAEWTGKTLTEHAQSLANSGLVQSIPIARTLGQNFTKGARKFDEDRLKDRMNHYDALGAAGREGVDPMGITDAVDRAAYMASRAKNGELDKTKTKLEAKQKPGQDLYGDYARIALERGDKAVKDSLLSRDPTLAKYSVGRENDYKSTGEYERAQDEAVKKAYGSMSVEAIGSLDIKNLKPEFLASFRNSILTQFGNIRSDEDRESLAKLLQTFIASKETDEKTRNTLSRQVEFLKQSPAWAGTSIPQIKNVQQGPEQKPIELKPSENPSSPFSKK